MRRRGVVARGYGSGRPELRHYSSGGERSGRRGVSYDQALVISSVCFFSERRPCSLCSRLRITGIDLLLCRVFSSPSPYHWPRLDFLMESPMCQNYVQD